MQYNIFKNKTPNMKKSPYVYTHKLLYHQYYKRESNKIGI